MWKLAASRGSWRHLTVMKRDRSTAGDAATAAAKCLVCVAAEGKKLFSLGVSPSLFHIYIMQDKFPFSPGRKVLPWLLVLLLFSWTRPKYASLAAFAAGQETLVACVGPAAIFSLEMLSTFCFSSLSILFLFGLLFLFFLRKKFDRWDRKCLCANWRESFTRSTLDHLPLSKDPDVILLFVIGKEEEKTSCAELVGVWRDPSDPGQSTCTLLAFIRR